MEIVAKEIISSYIPMRYRKLRITWTAICLIACVLLIVLWVRSHKWNDYLHKCVYGMRSLELDSAHGQVAISTNLLPATFGSNWSESGSEDMDGTPGENQRLTQN